MNSHMSRGFAKAAKEASLLQAAHNRSFEIVLQDVLRPRSKEKRPDELHHYTTGGGLHGILTSLVILASECRFLNDPDDSRYVFSLLKDKEFDSEPSLRTVAEAARQAIKERDGHYEPSGRIYVASFSEAGDDLGQWRAYAADGHGYAICFDATRLETLANSYFCRVVYDRPSQLLLVKTLVRRHVKLVDELEAAGMTKAAAVRGVGEALAIQLERVGPLLKHEAFAHEREWRLFVYSHPDATTAPEFIETRVRGQLVVPYLKLPFRSTADAGHAPLLSIRVGPAQDRRGVTSAVQLLRNLGYFSATPLTLKPSLGFFPARVDPGEGPPQPPYVYHSKIPYRSGGA